MNKRVHPLLDQHRKIPHRLRPRSARLSTTAYGWWMPAASTSRPDICRLDQRRRDRRPPGCTWTVPAVRSRALRSSTPPPSTTGTKPRSVRAWGIRSHSANTCRPARIGSARGWPNGPLDPHGAGPCGQLARRAGDRHHIREVQRCTRSSCTRGCCRYRRTSTATEDLEVFAAALAEATELMSLLPRNPDGQPLRRDRFGPTRSCRNVLPNDGFWPCSVPNITLRA
jgi:hypothetical protein